MDDEQKAFNKFLFSMVLAMFRMFFESAFGTMKTQLANQIHMVYTWGLLLRKIDREIDSKTMDEFNVLFSEVNSELNEVENKFNKVFDDNSLSAEDVNREGVIMGEKLKELVEKGVLLNNIINKIFDEELIMEYGNLMKGKSQSN